MCLAFSSAQQRMRNVSELDGIPFLALHPSKGGGRRVQRGEASHRPLGEYVVVSSLDHKLFILDFF